jgi:hypothetical protein
MFHINQYLKRAIRLLKIYKRCTNLINCNIYTALLTVRFPRNKKKLISLKLMSWSQSAQIQNIRKGINEHIWKHKSTRNPYRTRKAQCSTAQIFCPTDSKLLLYYLAMKCNVTHKLRFPACTLMTEFRSGYRILLFYVDLNLINYITYCYYCCSCHLGETMSLKCGHQRAYI